MRNETKRNETNQNETKQNETNLNETNQNQTKQNQTKPNDGMNAMLPWLMHLSMSSTDFISFRFVSQSTISQNKISPIFFVTVENFDDGMRSEERSLQRSSGVRMILIELYIV